ncbi:hypothetical protein [Methanohalophilus mahii]|uniref:Uncharacterized protein n=1 Tax=Methanohalophilus mahii (strain ATCC 35705 / DSM 5219 / SLP) TaxID=547558 RepID=D5EBS0_METMS|nr:hypothetical protein [Methanohalophilus mahii]ADE36621.1 hypothetical protein Mmah_1114 [Methanohalophilus mahii DSM 5219]
MAESQEQIKSGTYYVDENNDYHLLEPGNYFIDEKGNLNHGPAPAVNLQPAVDKIKWDEVLDLIKDWGHRGTTERTINLIGMYLLVAGIIAAASFLALRGIVEGQALVGFLGAAIGYLLSRGEIGLK